MADAIFVLVCLVLSVCLVMGINALAKDRAAHRAAFMSECLMDHKQYECTSMWRRGR